MAQDRKTGRSLTDAEAKRSAPDRCRREGQDTLALYVLNGRTPRPARSTDEWISQIHKRHTWEVGRDELGGFQIATSFMGHNLMHDVVGYRGVALCFETRISRAGSPDGSPEGKAITDGRSSGGGMGGAPTATITPSVWWTSTWAEAEAAHRDAVAIVNRFTDRTSTL